jgi:CRP/FNR family cyclic AMP-dependent transcriptional regulator
VDARKLEGVGLFSTLSRQDLERIARWMDELDVPEGKELTSEGGYGHEFFVIEEGEASVRHGDREIATLGPGDFFGEIALLETERRTATVISTSAMRLLVMFEREFKQMERELPAVADRVRSAIYARLH